MHLGKHTPCGLKTILAVAGGSWGQTAVLLVTVVAGHRSGDRSLGSTGVRVADVPLQGRGPKLRAALACL